MNTLKTLGKEFVNGYVKLAQRTRDIPAHVFYSFATTALIFFLTVDIWNRAINYHWSTALILGALFLALWSSTSWMILRFAHEEREDWRKRMIIDWILTLFFVGFSIAVANFQRPVTDPLGDGLDTAVAVILGFVIMAVSFGLLKWWFPKPKSNGNTT